MTDPSAEVQSISSEEVGDISEIMPEVAGEATETEETKQVVIKVPNPSKEEMAALLEDIKVKHDFDVDVKPVKFNFKKSKDSDTGIETIRNSVDLAIPYPSVQGIIAILEGEGEEEGQNKGLELLVEAMEGIVNTAARDLLYEDTNLSAANFPLDKITWRAISLLPKAQRRGGGIPKETWAEFAKDYIAIMPEATGKSLEQVANAAKILHNKMAQAKTSKEVLTFLVGQLAVYVDNSPAAEDYEECVSFLLQKADTFLNITEKELLANL